MSIESLKHAASVHLPEAKVGSSVQAARPKVENMSPERAAPTRETVERIAAQLDSYVKSIGRAIEFKVDDASGRVVVSVRDLESGELVRQIPSEEVLRLARGLDTKSLLVSLTV